MRVVLGLPIQFFLLLHVWVSSRVCVVSDKPIPTPKNSLSIFLSLFHTNTIGSLALTREGYSSNVSASVGKTGRAKDSQTFTIQRARGNKDRHDTSPLLSLLSLKTKVYVFFIVRHVTLRQGLHLKWAG